MSFEQGVLVRNGKVVGGTGPSNTGHTIWNAIKTAMTKRGVLWFKDAHVTDDATNSSTDIEVIQTVTEAAYDALPTTADGLYNVDDGTMVPLMAENVGFSDPSMSATDTKAAILEVKADITKIKSAQIVADIPSSGIVNLRTDGKPVIYVTTAIQGWYYVIGTSDQIIWTKVFNYNGTVISNRTGIIFYYYYLDS